MRSLSRSEARTLQALMMEFGGGERARIRSAAIPKTTFQTIRARALAAGWIVGREVPSGRPAGIGSIRVSLTQPFAEEQTELVRTLQADRQTLVLWDLTGATLSVTAAAPGAVGASEPTVSGRRSNWSVEVTERTGSCPAFFDFEGAWASAVLQAAPASYPIGWAWGPPASTRGVATKESTARAFYRHLTGLNGSEGAAPSAWDRLRDRRWGPRFHAEGWCRPRFFLNPWALPPIPVLPRPGVAFVYGRIRPTGDPSHLFARIFGAAALAPFLFVEDGRTALLGCLTSPGRSPVQARSVLEALQAELAQIEVYRVPADEIRPRVEYDFGRVVRAARARSARVADEG